MVYLFLFCFWIGCCATEEQCHSITALMSWSSVHDWH